MAAPGRRLLRRRQELHLHHQFHNRTHYPWAHVTASGTNPDIRRGRNVVYSLHAHLVFTPTYRRKVFTDEILRRCEDIMIEMCDSFAATLVEFNGEHDHVHLLVHHPPKAALSTLVNSLKGVSARLPRKEFPVHIRRYLWGGHFWSPSYFAASCGGAPLSIIKEYIENQKRPG